MDVLLFEDFFLQQKIIRKDFLVKKGGLNHLQVGELILLMVRSKSGEKTTVWMVLKPVVNNGINYQPQLVNAGFLPSTV